MASKPKTAEEGAAEQKAAGAAEAEAKADADAKVAAKTAGKRGESIFVKGPQGGRMRAGRRFGPGELEIELQNLTAAELEAIETDPHLSVRRVTG